MRKGEITINIPAPKVTQETIDQIASAAGLVKTICGIANNTAWLVISQSMEHITKFPGYRHRTKYLFKNALKELAIYERKLKYASAPRFFCLADLSEQARARFGDITDEDYYDFWCGLASKAYTKTFPFITCLGHKYETVFKARGYAYPDVMQWAMVSDVLLSIAFMLWRKCCKTIAEDTGLPQGVIENLFVQFSMERVLTAWDIAMQSIYPKEVKMTELEERNIHMTVEQLTRMMDDPGLIYDCTEVAIHDFADIFASKKEMKETIKEVRRARRRLEEE